MNSNGWWRVLLDLRWLVFAVVAAVAAFAFIVSYSHIYDLGRGHAQSGTAARLLPLSVDLLIVAASLVLFIQGRAVPERNSLAWWLPRGVLYAAIGATVAANVFYGLPHGWLAAVISGWPGAAFVAAVELAMVVARPARVTAPGAVLGTVPADVVEAAKARLRFALAHGFKVTDNELRGKFPLTRAAVTRVREEVLAESNGHGGTS